MVQDTEPVKVPVVEEWRPQPRILSKEKRSEARWGAKRKMQQDLHQMMKDKVAVELELMRRRHALQHKYYADQLKLQQGAEIAALQLQQNITLKEMELMTNLDIYRGKRMLLPNVNVAFGVASLDTYSPERCSPNNAIVFRS